MVRLSDEFNDFILKIQHLEKVHAYYIYFTAPCLEIYALYFWIKA